MTQEEQKRIIRTLETYGEPEAIAYSQRIEKWALETFSRDGHTPELRARGIHVDYRAVTDEAWYLLCPSSWPMPGSASCTRRSS